MRALEDRPEQRDRHVDRARRERLLLGQLGRLVALDRVEADRVERQLAEELQQVLLQAPAIVSLRALCELELLADPPFLGELVEGGDLCALSVRDRLRRLPRSPRHVGQDVGELALGLVA